MLSPRIGKSDTTIVYKQSARYKSLLIIPVVALVSIGLRTQLSAGGALTVMGGTVIGLAVMLALVAVKLTFGASALVLTPDTFIQKSPLISWELKWAEIISSGEFRLGSTPGGGVECFGFKILEPAKANWFLRMVARRSGYDLYIVDCWQEEFAVVVEEIRSHISASKARR